MSTHSQRQLTLVGHHLSTQNTSGSSGDGPVQLFKSKEKVTIDGHEYIEMLDFHPERKVKHEFFNIWGWGHTDTHIALDKQKGICQLTGTRYPFSNQNFPNMVNWAEKQLHADLSLRESHQTDIIVDPPIVNHAFVKELDSLLAYDRRSFIKFERAIHSRGESQHEVTTMRSGKFQRYADLVVYPGNNDHCEKIVQLACKHNVCIVPFGGGTNAAQDLLLSQREKRMIVSVDMGRMNKILWVDKANNLACIQAGINGVLMEDELAKFGVVTGHEPDSQEFSTLGGWISTRASGIKKNYYGNIEDIVQNVRIVTPIGVMTKLGNWSRVSTGPDLMNVVLGQEGNLGLITEAVVRVRPVPEVTEYESVVFPDYEHGCAFIQEVAKSRIWPASLRVMDELQFGGSYAIKPNDLWANLVNRAIDFYLTKIKGFNRDKIAAATIMFEGTKEEVARQKKNIYKLYPKYQGILGGSENGKKGYQFLYAVGYIRDFLQGIGQLSGTMETTVAWTGVANMISAARKCLETTCLELGFDPKKAIFSSRVTQIYETGATVYVAWTLNYFTNNVKLEDVIPFVEKIEHDVRKAMVANGGSLTHHHGVGKMKRDLLGMVLAPANIRYLKEMKKVIDPQNIFGAGNTIYNSEEAEIDDKEGAKFGTEFASQSPIQAKNLQMAMSAAKA